MTDVDSKNNSWASVLAIAPEKLISQKRSEAETLLKKNNTNIFNVKPEQGVHGEPQLYLADWHDDHGYEYRYERRGDWEILIVYCKVDDGYGNERVICKHKDMILDLQEDVSSTWKYLEIFQQGDVSIKLPGRGYSFRNKVVEYTDKFGTKKTFRMQNGDLLDDLMRDSYSILRSYDAKYTAILTNRFYSFLKGESVGLEQISEKRTDGTTIEYEQDPDLGRSLFEKEANHYDGMSILDAMEKINDDVAKEKLDAVNHHVLKKVSHDTETTFYINDVYLGKAVVDKEQPKGEYLGDNLESVTHCYDCNGKLVEEYIYRPVEPENIRKYGTPGYLVLMTYFDNGNIKMKKRLGGEPSLSENATYYDPNDNGRHLAFTQFNNSLMYARDDPESRKAMKDRFEIAMKTNDLQEARLALKMIFTSLKPFGIPEKITTEGSVIVRGQLIKFAVKVLGDGKIAVGGIYEDRHWVNETYKGNGIEWYWKASAVIFDLQNDADGVVAECHTDRINVRHQTDPNRDLWNKLDDNFMEIDEKTGKLTVGLKREYHDEWEVSASIDLKQKIAEYDKLVASIKNNDATTPEHKKDIAEKVKKYKEATEQQAEKNIERELNAVQPMKPARRDDR